MERCKWARAAATFVLVGLSLFGMTTSALAAGDATKGGDVAKRCMICHTFDNGGANKVGPNLFGVVGRTAGSVSGYNYSTAMKGAGFKWTEENLSAYLADPKVKVPGNKMAFAGLSKPDQIADLIAYLGTLK